MDINLFDFTTPKEEFSSSSQTLLPQEKQRRRRKKQADGQRENADEKLESDSNKGKRTNAESRKAREEEEDLNTCSNVPDVTTHILETCEDKSDRSCSQAAASGWVDVVQGGRHQKVGLLREKLLRLASSSRQQNTFPVPSNAPADTQPSGTEAAAESEKEGGNAPDTDVTPIHSQGDKSNSEVTEDADSHREEVEEEEQEVVLLPVSNAGSCKPLRKSQNSKYYPHCLTDSQVLVSFSLEQRSLTQLKSLYVQVSLTMNTKHTDFTHLQKVKADCVCVSVSKISHELLGEFRYFQEITVEYVLTTE